MTTINTTVPRARNVTRTVVEQVSEPVSGNVTVQISTSRHGSAQITLNGEPALVITKTGYLRRLRGLSERSGVRRLDDGRIAIKAASAS